MKNFVNFLTVWNAYGTNYKWNAYTCDVDSVTQDPRGLWWTAWDALRTGASPVKQLGEGPQGLGESLFFCQKGGGTPMGPVGFLCTN